MQNRYTQIQFIAANYSRLQGLKEVPVGVLVSAVSLWAMKNHGPNADLTLPLTITAGAILLYWLINRYYISTFGRIQQTSKMRRWETFASILFAVLALLAFWLDTAQNLPVSLLGLVFAAALFEDWWRVTSILKEKTFSLYPENLLAAILILLLSLLPLTGLQWWLQIGMPSQIPGILFIIGVLIVLAGFWGHLRILRALPVREVESDDNPL